MKTILPHSKLKENPVQQIKGLLRQRKVRKGKEEEEDEEDEWKDEDDNE